MQLARTETGSEAHIVNTWMHRTRCGRKPSERWEDRRLDEAILENGRSREQHICRRCVINHEAYLRRRKCNEAGNPS